MGSFTSKPQAPTVVLGVTVDDDDATKSHKHYQSQLTLLLKEITGSLASELTAVPPSAHPDPDPDPDPDPASILLTICAPAFKPKTEILSNIKVLIFATKHLRCNLTSLKLLADLQRLVVGQWHSDLAAVRSQARSGAKSKKNKHNNQRDSERKLIAELLGRLFDHTRAHDLLAVGEQQRSLLRELLKVKSEVEEKLSSHNKWRGRWNTIYTMAFFAVLVSCVALAAAAAPTRAMTVATVVSAAMKAAEPWFNALWDDRKAALEGEKDVIKAMVRDVSAQLHELDSVRLHVDKLKVAVGSVIGRSGNAGSSSFNLKMKKEYGLAFEKVDKGIEVLGEMADAVQREIKKAAANFVRMIADEYITQHAALQV